MKRNKLLLPTIFLVVAILATAVFSFVNCIAKKPTVTEAEFPFSITYELNGETITIEDVFSAKYTANSGYNDTKTRCYDGQIVNNPESSSYYTILKYGDGSYIELHTKFYADYLMGDPEYDYFDDESFEPQLLYYDAEGIEFTSEEILAVQGVKLVSFEYPVPIENSFEYSHISRLNAEVVIPSLIISILALLATIIFVKKDQGYVRKPINIISLIFNILISVFCLPYFTACAILFDALGDNESIFVQAFYFIPAITILSILSSIALRRKGYAKSGLIVQFISPVIFVIILIVAFFMNLI